jgi:DNA repair exonuclease SbcCD ATPase subunit|uniref:Chromosome partition protein n=1 Tax=Siphoviridae sp. cteHV32 TaxID=2825588 RepID=A0A8S5QGZ8_9CAUD|nr:MAG TPA: chromosome partition protein [Siphoviridae sp. cteHV32]
MKKVTLKKLSVENYKKFEAREFDFAGRTEVSGRNRQGKTSLMDAYFDVLTGKLADGTLPNNIRRKVDGEEVDDPVVRELVIDVDGTEYVVQKKTKKGKSSNTVEYYVNGIKRNKTEYMEILKRIADPDTIAMCSNARVFLNEIQKATAKARETLGGIAGFSESQFRAEHPEYEWIKNEGVEGDSIEEILKARRRDLRKAKSDVDDIAKQIRKEQGRQVECDETLPAQRDDLLDLLKENEKQEEVLCNASREYDRISIELAGLKRSRDALVEKAGKTAREKHDRITSLLYTLKSDKKNAENKLRLAEMDLEHANKGIERHKAALAQAKKKYTEALKEKWGGDTELTAIRGEEFDPELAICPTCGQTLPEEQVETAKRKFEFNKQSRISKKLGEKEQFEKNKRTKLEQITEDGNEASEGLKTANETKKEAEAAIEATKKEITSLALEIAETEKEAEKPIPEPDMSGDEEYKAVCGKISALEESLNGIGNGENDRILLSNNRHSLEAKLRDVEAKIKTQTARLEEKANNLETMQEEQKKLSQKQANIQQKVDQLTEYSIEKNKALAAVINPHFKHFQFQFLDYTQDGEPLETCRMICNGIDYANVLNHSDRILCDIDLVMGLQEMNDLRLPVWVDDTESVNSDRIPELDTQMILLKVSDGELKVKGI